MGGRISDIYEPYKKGGRVMSKPVIGIDPSLNNTAYCVLWAGESIVGKIGVGSKKGVPRLLHIERTTEKLLELYQPQLIVIEGYSHASAHQAHQAGELGGILRRLFHVYGIRWVDVAPGTLKKFVTGKGNADKSMILLNVYKRWGVELKNHDEADAFGLAKLGTYLCGADASGLTKPQLEALRTVQKKLWGVLL